MSSRHATSLPNTSTIQLTTEQAKRLLMAYFTWNNNMVLEGKENVLWFLMHVHFKVIIIVKPQNNASPHMNPCRIFTQTCPNHVMANYVVRTDYSHKYNSHVIIANKCHDSCNNVWCHNNMLFDVPMLHAHFCKLLSSANMTDFMIEYICS